MNWDSSNKRAQTHKLRGFRRDQLMAYFLARARCTLKKRFLQFWDVNSKIGFTPRYKAIGTRAG